MKFRDKNNKKMFLTSRLPRLSICSMYNNADKFTA